jgi:hypothetical protein
MTPYLDKLRKQRKSDWVFVNSHGEPYTTSTSSIRASTVVVRPLLRVCLLRVVNSVSIRAATSYSLACSVARSCVDAFCQGHV